VAVARGARSSYWSASASSRRDAHAGTAAGLGRVRGSGPPRSRLVAAGDVRLEVADCGAGEPVLLVQTALTADELLPLGERLLRLGPFRVLLHHRRGYATSDPATRPGSVRRDAGDCRELLTALDLDHVHVVGPSYGAAVALQLAADFPQQVRTLTLIEPPPVDVDGAAEFRAVGERLLATRRERGVAVALEEFLTMVIGGGWRSVVERVLPGSARQMHRDAATFFDVDLPALLAWRFRAADAERVGCPVLYVGGTESGPWFDQVHQLMLRWLPHAEDVMIPGADHNLALTHPDEVAAALIGFLHGRRSSGVDNGRPGS
jgi:pimeloyl-ACP methyl ester carboxylesterase